MRIFFSYSFFTLFFILAALLSTFLGIFPGNKKLEKARKE